MAKQSLEYGEAELFADLPSYLRFEVRLCRAAEMHATHT